MLTYILSLFLMIGCKEQLDTTEKEPEIIYSTFDLVSPAHQVIDVEVLPSFEWDTVGNASYYQLQIAYDSLFNDIVLERETTEHQITLEEELPFGAYLFWRVLIFDENDTQVGISLSNYQLRTIFGEASPSPSQIIYYVSPNGIDHPLSGTIDQPFKSISYAAHFIPENENDTLYIFNGEYQEVEPIMIKPGIHLKGENKENVIIRSSGVSVPDNINTLSKDYSNWYEGSLIQLISPDREVKRYLGSKALAPVDGNQSVSHLTIDGENKQLKAGLWVENRNNIHLHDLTIKNCEMRGAIIAAGNKEWYKEPEYYLEGIRVNDCSFINSSKDFDNGSSGNLNLGQLKGAEIYNIQIDDDEGYGIKFMFDGYFRDCEFYNITTNLSEEDELWGEDIAIELWNLGPGNKVHDVVSNTWLSLVNHPRIFNAKASSLNIEVYNIHISDQNKVSSKEGLEIGTPHVLIRDCLIENKGMGIALWNMGRENIHIRNNIFRNDRYQYNWAGGSGIYIDNSQDWTFDDIHIYNNVFDKNVYGILIKGQNLGEFNIHNNLFIESKTFDVYSVGGQVMFTHNFLDGSEWKLSDQITESQNLFGDALIWKTGDMSNQYYVPKVGSPLIDAGKNMDLPFEGSAPDIGYFETSTTN
ncbi:right-handed parallel beta-helix repeat-containing protein [Flammeovirga yaeyamensis]|nr:right-handed parallel beta-helix repeat-containing protein [Flammeovirga yaeyamensis]MBB3699312.1 hypothetical protein [Flammeovirga yaeyamensis]